MSNVTSSHQPELEDRRSGCHDRVLRCELAKRYLVVGLHHREPVGVLISENRAEHDHVATLEARAPMGSVPAHDLAFPVGQSLSEIRARRDEA